MKLILFSLLILICNSSFGKARDIVTTRLMSTSGAGVGAILFNEASVLNPASIAYFDYSSFYYQKSGSDLGSESVNRTDPFDEGTEESVIIADTSSSLNGTFSYNHIKESNVRTKRLATSASNPITQNSSIGFLLSYYESEQVSPEQNRNYRFETAVGYSLVFSKKITFGAVYQDIARSDIENQMFLGGFQLEISDNLHFLLDGGFNPNYAADKKSIQRFAFQVNFLSSVFLRLGQFFDKSTNLKGSSWGLSWVGPKISFDYAFRKSESISSDLGLLLKGEILDEHSLAMSVRF